MLTQVSESPRATHLPWAPLVRMIIRRVLMGVVLVFVVATLAFFATSLLPGDPVSAVLGRNASAERMVQLRQELGLDRPLLERYGSWLSGVLVGDFGNSMVSGTPVSELLGRRLVNSLALAVLAGIILIPSTILVGAWIGARQGSPADRSVSMIALVFLSFPEFVLGILLAYVFGVQLKIFPAASLFDPETGPLSRPETLVLPVATMVLVNFGYAMRLVRSGVAKAMESDYVQFARLNGVSEARVIRQYALRNSMAPSIQATALVMLYLVAGVVVVEATFQYPGIGLLAANAAMQRDLPIILGVVVTVAVLYILVNLITDLVIIMITPKLRTAL